MADKIFAEGIRFERPNENAPDFVKGKISVNLADFTAWATKNVNERGWINLDLKKSKEKGTLYLELNTYKKAKTPEDEVKEHEAEINKKVVNPETGEEIPF